MSNNFQFNIRSTRRQAIVASIFARVSTLFTERTNVKAQENLNLKSVEDPYDGFDFPDGFVRDTTNIGEIELHHVTGGNLDAPVVSLLKM